MTYRSTLKSRGLPARLYLARRALGLSQAKVAELTGISATYVAQLEKGYREPTAHKVALLAGVLGCTTDHLILGR